MYREKPNDDPITASEIMALWWRKHGCDTIVVLVACALFFSIAFVVRSCERRSVAVHEREDARWVEISKGTCRDYSYSIDPADSATCPRTDQRLKLDGLRVYCNCKEK